MSTKATILEDDTNEGYPTGWVKVTLMVSPTGELNAIGGGRVSGEDSDYPGLDRILKFWKHKGTNSPVQRHIHVIPIGDLEVHSAQEICWCHPTETTPLVWVHNAKDCREVKERQTGEKCSDGWINIAEFASD